MIDIHSHILPMIDDGASSVEMALDLLSMAYDDGTDAIVLTPHYADSYGFDNPYDKIKMLFDDLQFIVKQERIPIQLYLGTEYLFSSPEHFLQHQHEIARINQTQYLLMEFFFDVTEDQVIEAVDYVLKSGYIPIIAHPERYECIQSSFQVVEDVIHQGALLQMNKGSITGKYGHKAMKTVFQMLDHHYIHFIGSDAHHPRYRSSRMYEDFQMMCEIYDEEYAYEIFIDNPKMMLNNKDIRKKENHEEKY